MQVLGAGRRNKLHQGLNLALIITSAMMIWKFLILVTGSESPVVVVLSGSMEPGFKRGDILFLMKHTTIELGDVIVFTVDGRAVPIVHRVVSRHDTAPQLDNSSSVQLLTKGDNNFGDDRILYAKGQRWLAHENVMGKVIGYLPHVGLVTILMNDYVYIKYALIGLLSILVLKGGE